MPQHQPALTVTSGVAQPRALKLHTDKQSATIMMAYPGITLADPDRHAMILLQTYLGGYSSQGGSKLFETLRGLGLVYTATAADISGPAGGMFLISAQGEPQNADAIVAKINQIVEEVRAGNLPDNLLAAAKDQTITGEKLSKQTIAEKSGAEALDEALGLGWQDSQTFPEKIRSVTKADVIRVAKKYLANPTVVVLTPTVPPAATQTAPNTVSHP
jgi:predicted Zn-dependent peptidase